MFNGRSESRLYTLGIDTSLNVDAGRRAAARGDRSSESGRRSSRSSSGVSTKGVMPTASVEDMSITLRGAEIDGRLAR